MSISAREGRQIDKGKLILLDNCCNLQVSNIRSLFSELTENTSGSANTLGGKYSPRMKGFSEHIGYALFDEECGVTVFSYKKLLDQNRIIQRDKYTYDLLFPSLQNFSLRFTWIDEVLAADITPLLQKIAKLEGQIHTISGGADNTIPNMLGRHWTQTDLDKPTNVMQMYKLIPNMSKAQVRRLDNVHQAMKGMWSPSKQDLKDRMSNELESVDFTTDDVDMYFEMFDRDLSSLKGRTENPDYHNRSAIADLQEGQVLLSSDIMDMAGKNYIVAVLVSPQHNNQIGNIFLEQIPNRSALVVSEALISIGQHIQSRWGYKLKIVFDKEKGVEFNKDLIERTLQCEVDQVDGHADHAENAIKWIKQRVRIKLSSLVADVNATQLHGIVIGATLILNKTGRKGNGGRSPYTVLNPGKKVNYKSFYKFSPSDLVEVHTHKSNSVLNMRTTTAVPLHPSISCDTDWIFYSLETGRVFCRDYRLAYKVPWSFEARLRMKYLAYTDPVARDDHILLRPTPSTAVARYEMPRRIRGAVGRRNVNAAQAPAVMNDVEPEAEPPMPAEVNVPEVVNATLNSFLHENVPEDDMMNFFDKCLYVGDATNVSEDKDHFHQHLGVYASMEIDHHPIETTFDVRGSFICAAISIKEMDSVLPDGTTCRLDYQGGTFLGSIMTTLVDSDLCLSEKATVVQYAGSLDGRGALFATQVSARKAEATFGAAGTAAIETEISSLLRKKVFSAVVSSSLSREQRKRIIRMSCFVRDKTDAEGNLLKIKARLVAGGHMQDKSIYSSDQISSPTVSTSSVFSIISSGISESRKFLKFDISTAYLNAKMPEDDLVYMKLDKQMSEMLLKCDTSGEFRAAMQESDDGQCTVKLEKALYGCVQSARLWYNHLSGFLQRIGFTPNPVDPCVFNRISSAGKQCTLAMHVDDGLATCVDVEELKKLDQEIRKEFNNEVESEIDCKTFDYVGIKVDTKDGTEAELTMQAYIKEVCEEFGVKNFATTPAADNLFKVSEEQPKLNKDGKDRFHRSVAQLLYLATRVRPDILLPITFLCSRVSEPTTEDLTKLERVFRYLNGTSHLGIMLGKYGQEMSLTVYADASYAVHDNCKSHGGIVVFHNRGPVLVKSAKQKIVSKSSTEAELITLSDAVSIAAYNVNFLKGQGYNVCADLKQDNTSTIRLAEHGRSNSDRTKHIAVRFYFVKQYLDDNVMKIQHCPTKEMIADICTKPIQGSQFKVLRDMLLGYA